MWPSLDSRNTSSQYFSTGDWPEQLHSNPNLTLTLSRIRIGTRPDVIILRSHFTMTSTSSAHLICLCGAISAPGTLLADPEIPISVEICYCNPCRRTTGSLGVSFPALNSSPSPEILSKLTGYHSSQVLTRYFCSTCGCHCFLLHQERKKWYCLGGIIEPSPALGGNKTQWPKDTLKVSRHQCVPRYPRRRAGTPPTQPQRSLDSNMVRCSRPSSPRRVIRPSTRHRPLPPKQIHQHPSHDPNKTPIS